MFSKSTRLRLNLKIRFFQNMYVEAVNLDITVVWKIKLQPMQKPTSLAILTVFRPEYPTKIKTLILNISIILESKLLLLFNLTAKVISFTSEKYRQFPYTCFFFLTLKKGFCFIVVTFFVCFFCSVNHWAEEKIL